MDNIVAAHNGYPEFDLTNMEDYLLTRVPEDISDDIMARFNARIRLQNINIDLCSSCASFCKQGSQFKEHILPNGPENPSVMVVLSGGTFMSQCIGTSGYGPNEYILRKLVENAGYDNPYVTDMYKCPGKDDTCIKHFLAEEFRTLSVSVSVLVVEGMDTFNKLIEHGLIKCSQKPFTYGNLYNVTFEDGSQAMAVIIFPLDKLSQSTGVDYTKHINSIWGQMAKIRKAKQ